jgi:hypothetical protein
MEDFMQRNISAVAIALLLLSTSAIAQLSSTSDQGSQESTKITVRGCVRSERGNYILIENRTGMVYALQGVGNKLQSFLRKEVEVTGESKPGSVKTGVRPEKAGSNPSDTVHGIDGVPLEVKDIDKDIRVVAKHCKAADQQ